MIRDAQAILFDNDGVLVDTESLFFRATQEALAKVGAELTRELYVEYILRRGESVFFLAVERGGDEPELRAWRNERYAELIRGGVTVLHGVRKTLAALHGTRPMAVVTSSGRAHFEQIHASLGLLDHFDFVLAEGDYARMKPAPDPYLAAAERLGLDPADCLAVEDSERGLRSACAAGMPCVVVPNDFTRDGDFREARAVLSTLTELLARV